MDWFWYDFISLPGFGFAVVLALNPPVGWIIAGTGSMAMVLTAWWLEKRRAAPGKP